RRRLGGDLVLLVRDRDGLAALAGARATDRGALRRSGRAVAARGPSRARPRVRLRVADAVGRGAARRRVPAVAARRRRSSRRPRDGQRLVSALGGGWSSSWTSAIGAASPRR